MISTLITKYLYVLTHKWCRGSSVSIVSGYGLDDRMIEVRSPAGTTDFSSNLCVQTGSGAHPVSCPMGTRGPFPGVKRGRSVTLTTHPHLVRRSWMSKSYTSSPPAPKKVCSGTTLTSLLTLTHKVQNPFTAAVNVARFQVLAANMKMRVFWDTESRNLIEVEIFFSETARR
jgi:hypothetical protein